MSALHEYIIVACPPQIIRQRLLSFFSVGGNRADDDGRLHVRLRFHIGDYPKTAVEHVAIATLRFRPLGADTMPRFQIEWAAERPGPYPLFYGTLSVSRELPAHGVRFDLQGQYTPPLGLFDAPFDARLGRHIAHGTAANLLHDIKHFVEQTSAENESAGFRTRRSTVATGAQSIS